MKLELINNGHKVHWAYWVPAHTWHEPETRNQNEKWFPCLFLVENMQSQVATWAAVSCQVLSDVGRTVPDASLCQVRTGPMEKSVSNHLILAFFKKQNKKKNSHHASMLLSPSVWAHLWGYRETKRTIHTFTFQLRGILREKAGISTSSMQCRKPIWCRIIKDDRQRFNAVFLGVKIHPSG